MGAISKTTIVAECLKSAKHIRPDPSARENLFANAVSQRIFSVTLSIIQQLCHSIQ